MSAADLALAERVAAAQVVEPSREELKALDAFCVKELKARQKAEECQERIGPLVVESRSIRAKLYDAMTEAGKEVLVIPRDVLQASAKKLVGAGMEELPPYIRLMKNNKDATITTETVHEALTTLTVEDVRQVMEEGSKPLTVSQALEEAVLSKVRTAVREYTEQVKLSTSVPRGMRAVDVEEASPELAALALQLHTAEHGAKALRSISKEASVQKAAECEALVPLISSFLDRSQLTSQRVIVGGQPYRLVKREVRTKQVIRFGTISSSLQDALERVWNLVDEAPANAATASKRKRKVEEEEEEEPQRKRGTAKAKKSSRPSLEVLDKLLTTKRKELVEHVVTSLSSLPPSVKTEVKLVNVRRPATATAVDGGDGEGE